MHTMKLNRSLKIGIDSAMTHETTQRMRAMATQDPLDSSVVSCMWFVPRKRRTYTYFAATWPLTMPAIRICKKRGLDVSGLKLCCRGGDSCDSEED